MYYKRKSHGHFSLHCFPIPNVRHRTIFFFVFIYLLYITNPLLLDPGWFLHACSRKYCWFCCSYVLNRLVSDQHFRHQFHSAVTSRPRWSSLWWKGRRPTWCLMIIYTLYWIICNIDCLEGRGRDIEYCKTINKKCVLFVLCFLAVDCSADWSDNSHFCSRGYRVSPV